MKSHHNIFMLLFFIFLISFNSMSAQTLTAPMQEEGDALEIEQLEEYREIAWDQWKETMLDDEILQTETEKTAMTFGEATMLSLMAMARSATRLNTPSEQGRLFSLRHLAYFLNLINVVFDPLYVIAVTLLKASCNI